MHAYLRYSMVAATKRLYMHPCALCFHVEFFPSWRDYKYISVFKYHVYIYIHHIPLPRQVCPANSLQKEWYAPSQPQLGMWMEGSGGWAGRSRQYFSPLLLLSFLELKMERKQRIHWFFFLGFFPKTFKNSAVIWSEKAVIWSEIAVIWRW